MALPSIGLFSSPATGNATSPVEDPNKKVRKPYTISKSRENWTDPEHDKFLEALQLFDRDWKKIEEFIGSKTVIQIRSHAQKYFLKAQKSGTNEHLPPPRPKRKAAHPYPQKASKIVVSQEKPAFQGSAAVPDAAFARGPYPATLKRNGTAASMHGWTEKPLHCDARCAGQTIHYIDSSVSNESTTRTRPTVLPDFAQVYSFIGSIFDPAVTGHLQKLKKMSPIDIETVLLLMRNLSINLASRDLEDHRRLLSSDEIEPEKDDAFEVTESILCSQSEGAG